MRNPYSVGMALGVAVLCAAHIANAQSITFSANQSGQTSDFVMLSDITSGSLSSVTTLGPGKPTIEELILKLPATSALAPLLSSPANFDGTLVETGVSDILTERFAGMQVIGQKNSSGVETVDLGFSRVSISTAAVTAPEIDATFAVSSLTLLLGGLVTLRGRRQPRVPS
jgi:hypothetical protein